MRAFATGLLGLMLLLFVACTALEPRFPWLAYPAAFAEAGMVGACADWFAVVALFRRPFGLPIPHTAILPRNKQRLADQLGAFIAGNFLAPAEITPRLARLDVAGWIAEWLKDPAHVEIVAEASQALLPPALELVGDEELRGFVQNVIREGVDGVAAAPMLGRALTAATERGYHWAAYDRGIDWATQFLQQNRALIGAKAAERRPGLISRWIDRWAADAFSSGFLETLESARAGDHPWRGEYEAFLKRLAERLTHDPETFERCEAIKRDVLGARLVDGYVVWLGDQAEAWLRRELESSGGVVTRALRRGLAKVGAWLETDTRMREMINRWSRQVILGAVVPNRSEIGAFVTDVVARWDTATMVGRLEAYVGRDLQYIRINGTIVGGLVGLTLFVLTRLLSAQAGWP